MTFILLFLQNFLLQKQCQSTVFILSIDIIIYWEIGVVGEKNNFVTLAVR